MNKKVGLELESIIIDKDGTPVNYIEGEIASKVVLNLLSQKVPEAVKEGIIGPELDACQIEVKNSTPRELDIAILEIQDLYKEVEKIVERLGYSILDGGFLENDFVPVCSEMKPHYLEIDRSLREYSLESRKGTNIAGIHIHLDLDNDFERFIRISDFVRKAILNNNLSDVYMTQNRYQMMEKVIEALVNGGFFKNINDFTKSMIPYSFKDKNSVLAKAFFEGERIPNYSLVTIKKPGGYTVEVRTMDSVAGTSKIGAKISSFGESLFNVIN